MNIIDSDSMRSLAAVPDNPAAVPGAAQAQKTTAALKTRLAKILSASGVKSVDAEDEPSHFTLGVERLDQALAAMRGKGVCRARHCMSYMQQKKRTRPTQPQWRYCLPNVAGKANQYCGSARVMRQGDRDGSILQDWWSWVSIPM